MKLLAVPLHDLYDGTHRFGPLLASIPHLLSRYNFEYVDEEDNVVAVTPGGNPLESSVPRTRVLVGQDVVMAHSDSNVAQGDGNTA